MSIFRKYDVRGVYGKDLDEQLFEKMGNAFGQILSKDTVVARDSRLHSKSLQDALVKGILQTGTNIINIGEVPISCAMHWAWANTQTLAYVTGSHKAKDWNGIKFFHHTGLGFSEEEQQKIKKIIDEENMIKTIGSVHIGVEPEEAIASYNNHVAEKIKAERPLKVVIDCGNGSTGILAKALFERAGFEAETIFEEPDGNFPNRLPDPQEDELEELKKRMKGADLGVAYDGDGDRVFLMDSNGRKLLPEQTSFLILDELLAKNKGPVVANVECNSTIDDIAKKYGCEVKRAPVGHTFLIEWVHKFGAVYGVERAGHYALPLISKFDDAMGVSLYAASVLSRSERPLHEIVDEMPARPFERLRYECSDDKKFAVVETLKKKLSQEYNNINTLDGIRIDTENGWVLIRASNTGPVIRLTVEADDDNAFQELKEKFSGILESSIQ